MPSGGVVNNNQSTQGDTNYYVNLGNIIQPVKPTDTFQDAIERMQRHIPLSH